MPKKVDKKMKIDINARRDKILRIIINNYITTGNPVSSRTICTQYHLNLCAASVRNVMADLEERGLITHLHTSAGRVPTDKGYRFYVDQLLDTAGLTSQEKTVLSNEYIDKQLALDEIVRRTSRVLSQFTNYAAVVSQPQLKKSKFKRIQFVLLDNNKVCVMLVTSTGMTKSSVVNFDIKNFKIDKDKLKRIENFMNDQLEDVPLDRIRTKLRKMMIQERNSLFMLLKQAIEFVDSSSLIEEKTHFYWEGFSNILNFPEFENSAMIRSFMKIFDERDSWEILIQEIIDRQETTGEKIKVFIGKEAPEIAFDDCAIVMGGYQINKQILGTLGIIGPKRMDYGKAIATVSYVSGILSAILENYSLE
ncbi:MAG: heat-inducible transcriptional repressor HrcA [Candidatus Omnitrophota bacterium]